MKKGQNIPNELFRREWRYVTKDATSSCLRGEGCVHDHRYITTKYLNESTIVLWKDVEQQDVL